MTKRAELAAAELARRGWMIESSEPAVLYCPRCSTEVSSSHSFCFSCGERLPDVFGQSSLDDIEAAIAAAIADAIAVEQQRICAVIQAHPEWIGRTAKEELCLAIMRDAG